MVKAEPRVAIVQKWSCDPKVLVLRTCLSSSCPVTLEYKWPEFPVLVLQGNPPEIRVTSRVLTGCAHYDSGVCPPTHCTGFSSCHTDVLLPCTTRTQKSSISLPLFLLKHFASASNLSGLFSVIFPFYLCKAHLLFTHSMHSLILTAFC